jgi:urease accessory protein
VLVTLGIADAGGAVGVGTAGAGAAPVRTFAQMFALATARWQIEVRPAAQAFAFTWAEAQTSAAVRLVPLGQSAGVRILAEVARQIPAAVDGALALTDDELSGAAPQHALLSTAHETQYTRLFRS